MFKVVLAISLFGAALAQYGGHGGGYGGGLGGGLGGGYGGGYKHEEIIVDQYTKPEYKFDYSVQDHHTYDDKKHAETRHGDVVKGFYALKEADGTIREVHYEADHKNGFNAKVIRKGHAVHPEVGTSKETFYKHGHGYGAASSSYGGSLGGSLGGSSFGGSLGGGSLGGSSHGGSLGGGYSIGHGSLGGGSLGGSSHGGSLGGGYSIGHGSAISSQSYSSKY